MSVKRNEHFLFMDYSLKVRDFLRDNLYLSSYPEDKNVGVYYSTPARAYAKFLVPVINGDTLYPKVTFRLTGYERTQGQSPNGYFKLTKTIGDDEYQEIRHPLVYSLTYRVTFWAAQQADMDILTYQAITAAPFERKYPITVDGQWGEICTQNFSDEGSMDPGEAQDISYRNGFDITINRAYLPLQSVNQKGIVKKYNFDWFLEKD